MSVVTVSLSLSIEEERRDNLDATTSTYKEGDIKNSGLALSGMLSALILTAVMASTATPALADWEVWHPRCGAKALEQPFELFNLSLVTQEQQQLLSSAYSGSVRICGAWARLFNPKESTPYENGALTFAVQTDIVAPPGVVVGDLRGVPNDRFAGTARFKILQWASGYDRPPAIAAASAGLYTDSRRQVDPYSERPNDRKGCPRDQEGATVILCLEVDLGYWGSNWFWTTTNNPSLPPEDQAYTASFGEAFGVDDRLASIVEINGFGVCRNLGVDELDCGDTGDPKIHYNGYAAVDDRCSDGVNGVYRATAYNRNGDMTSETPGSVSCMPWTE